MPSDIERLTQLTTHFAQRHAECEVFRKLLEPLRLGNLEPVEGETLLLEDLNLKLQAATDLLAKLPSETDLAAQFDRLETLLDDINWELAQDLLDDLKEKRTRQMDLLNQTGLDLKNWESRLAEVAKVIDGARLEGAPFAELERDLFAARASIARVRSALGDRLYSGLATQKVAAEDAIKTLEAMTNQRGPQISKVKKLVKQADLLIMQVAGKRGKFEYRVLLRSADRFQTRGINIIQDVRSLSAKDRTWMTDQVKRLTVGVNEARRSAHPGSARTIMAAVPTSNMPPNPAELISVLGDFMFRLIIPEQIQAYLRNESWSFTITTNDLELPWELVAFDSPNVDGDIGLRPLCLERSVSRMPLGGVFPLALPPRRMKGSERKRRMLLIYSDPEGNLPAAKTEVDLIASQLGQTIEVERINPDEATNAHINAVLMGQSFDFIHFAGHAHFDKRNPGESGLRLKDDVLTADKIRRLSRGGSLVFLNACESGTVARDSEPQQVSYLMTMPEPVVGLASAFVYSGALGCVGSLWPVYDRPAAQLAVDFYRYVLNGEPIGEALRQARSDSYAAYPREITWAGYVLYGDPTFRLTET